MSIFLCNLFVFVQIGVAISKAYYFYHFIFYYLISDFFSIIKCSGQKTLTPELALVVYTTRLARKNDVVQTFILTLRTWHSHSVHLRIRTALRLLVIQSEIILKPILNSVIFRSLLISVSIDFRKSVKVIVTRACTTIYSAPKVRCYKVLGILSKLKIEGEKENSV